MSTNTFSSLAQAVNTLAARLANGKPQPKQHPERLEPGRIELWPDVFQHRRPGKTQSSVHIESLARAAKNGELEPLLIWWDGKKWACIDGHHRIQAYTKADMKGQPVPVKVFEGTLQEAMAEAATRNSRDKLQMSKGEKMNTAWRLVVATELSKADTVRASGASDGQVAQMRRVRKQLTEQGRDCRELGWQEARKLAAGDALDDGWDPGATEKEAKEIADKLVRALGKRASKRVEAFALALEIYDPRLPELLAEWWSERDGDAMGLEDDE